MHINRYIYVYEPRDTDRGGVEDSRSKRNREQDFQEKARTGLGISYLAKNNELATGTRQCKQGTFSFEKCYS